ncbi:MAG: hypothetical protein QXX08_02885 [Candidatus Bathyarchaeia archaeon]
MVQEMPTILGMDAVSAVMLILLLILLIAGVGKVIRSVSYQRKYDDDTE